MDSIKGSGSGSTVSPQVEGQRSTNDFMKQVLEEKPSLSPKENRSVPVSIPITMITNKDQLDGLMRNSQASLGKHQLPFAPPPQRETYRVQSHVRPQPKPQAMDNKAVQTDNVYSIRPSEINLLSFIREKEITSFKVMSIINDHQLKQKLPEQDKPVPPAEKPPAEKPPAEEPPAEEPPAEEPPAEEPPVEETPAEDPTATESQNNENANEVFVHMSLDDLSNFNKKQLVQMFNFGVSAAKLYSRKRMMASAQTRPVQDVPAPAAPTTPTAFVTSGAPAVPLAEAAVETEPTGEESISKQVKRDVMNTLKELIQAGTLQQLPQTSVIPTEAPTEERPPVPALKRMRADESHQPTMPTYTEAPMQRAWQTVPMLMPPTYSHSYSSANQGVYVNGMPHIMPHNDQVSRAKKAGPNINKVHSAGHSHQQATYSRMTRTQQFASSEYQALLDAEFRRAQEIQKYHRMQEANKARQHQQAVQQQGSYPNTHWSNYQHEN